MRTYSPKPGDVTRQWHVIDAHGRRPGPSRHQAAILLRGKHKPIFAPHVDTGDFVIIINADKVAPVRQQADPEDGVPPLGYPGGLRSVRYDELLAKNPEKAVEKAIKGMLPKNSLGRQMLSQAEGLRGRPSTRTRRSSRCRSRSPRSRSSPRPPPKTCRKNLRRIVAETTAERPLDERTRRPSYDHRVRAPVEGEYTSESLARASATRSRLPATGRRKKAIARVRIVPGTGKWTINGRTLEDYFPNKVHQQDVNEPFKVLELDGRYDVIARIARWRRLRPGRCAAPRRRPRAERGDVDNNRATLKKAGFLTRDDRAVERKKAGLKKARKAPQYSKR